MSTQFMSGQGTVHVGTAAPGCPRGEAHIGANLRIPSGLPVMQQPAGGSEIRIDQGPTSEHLKELRAGPILPIGTCSLIRRSQFTKGNKGGSGVWLVSIECRLPF